MRVQSLGGWAPQGAGAPSPLRKSTETGALRPAGRAKKLHREQAVDASAAGADELGCPHFHQCSGCTLNSGLARPSTLAAAEHYFRELGYEGFRLHVGPTGGWRWRARLAVRRGAGGPPVVGLFAAGSHDCQPIPDCVVHHPAINAAVEVVTEAMEACATQPYDEPTGGGELRYLQLTVVEPPAGPHPAPPQVQVVLVWNAAADAAGDDGGSRGGSHARLAQLAGEVWRLGEGRGRLLHSVYANANGRRDNTILGPDWRLLHGAAAAWAALGGARVAFAPGSFMQVNPGAMDACLGAMQGFVPEGASIVDLHAGVGTIGLSLAATRSPRRVRFVELNPNGREPFLRSAAALAEEGSTVELEYHVASAGADPGRWCEGADVAVVDPPRKGLDAAALAFLAGGAAPASLRRLLYLSCGFPALTRDCAALLRGGHWRLAHAEAFLFFPGTDHIETLAVFDRWDGGSAGAAA